MKAKFIGDPSEGSKPSVPEEFEAFGVVFGRNKFSDVPDDVAGKIAGNNHFEVQGKAPEANG